MSNTARIKLTPGKIKDFNCESGQSFLWDSNTAGLAVRATPGGKAYILQSRFAGKTIRITLGDITALTLDTARTEAKRLLLMIEQGIDPREHKRKVVAEQQAARAEREREDSAEQIKTTLVSEAWNAYLAERRPRWSERHHLDHVKLSQDGKVKRRKGGGLRKPGPLFPLLSLRLVDVTPSVLESWIKEQAADRPTQSRLALRLFRGFLGWCSEHELYKAVTTTNVITAKVKEVLPKKVAKTDCLMKEQLAGWFGAVRQIQNPVIAAYLQGLLLTGARKEELAGLKWDDVDFRWKSITIRDKMEGERVIPLTPFMESLIQFLPRRNEWVFSSPTAATGRLQEPFAAHRRALAVAGIDHLTLHGLRRSFGSLSEWVELPVGIVAQIMGHRPSATAEKHYRVRPLDLLRQWHTRLENWILSEAGIPIPEQAEQTEPLRLVASN